MADEPRQSKSKRHHWWPKAHSRYWGENGRVTRVVVNENGIETVDDNTPAFTAVIENLNTADRGTKDDVSFENFLLKYDTNASKILTSFRDFVDERKSTELKFNVRKWIIRYLSSILFRVPSWRSLEAEGLDDDSAHKGVANEYIESFGRMLEIMSEKLPGFDRQADFRQNWGIEAARDNIKYFSEGILAASRIEFSEVPKGQSLLFSDAPYEWRRSPDNLKTIPSQLIMPLFPDWAIILQTNINERQRYELRFTGLEPEQVTEINDGIIARARREIFLKGQLSDDMRDHIQKIHHSQRPLSGRIRLAEGSENLFKIPPFAMDPATFE